MLGQYWSSFIWRQENTGRLSPQLLDYLPYLCMACLFGNKDTFC